MEESDDRKRKTPEVLSEEDGLTSLNPSKVAKSHTRDAITKLDRHDSGDEGPRPELDSKNDKDGSLEEEAEQVEQFGSHSGSDDEETNKKEALDPKAKDSSVNGKGKEVVKDKGKGKILVESESDDDDGEEEEDGRGSGGDEDTDSDLSDDPLMEVDPANILPSWTRRRAAYSGPYPMPSNEEVDDDDDDDDDDNGGGDVSGGEDEVDDDDD